MVAVNACMASAVALVPEYNVVAKDLMHPSDAWCRSLLWWTRLEREGTTPYGNSVHGLQTGINIAFCLLLNKFDGVGGITA